MNTTPSNHSLLEKITIILISISIFLLQLPFWASHGTGDVNLFMAVVEDQELFKLKGAYSYYNLNYPPLTSVFFYPLTWLENYRAVPPETKLIMIKILIAFFYYSFLITIFFYYRQKNQWFTALKKTNLIFCNLALIESAIILGYTDVMFAPFLLLTFYFFDKKNYFLSGCFIAITFMIKLLPILLIPGFMIFFFSISSKYRLAVQKKSLIYFLLGMSVIAIPLVYYFGFDEIKKVLIISHGMGGKALLSHAFNFTRILNIANHQQLLPLWTAPLSRFLFYSTSFALLLKLLTSKKNVQLLLYTSLGIFLSYFIFSSGAHENHIYPALIVAIILFIRQQSTFNTFVYYYLTVISFVNLFLPYALGVNFNSFFNNIIMSSVVNYYSLLVIIVSCLSIIVFLYILKYIDNYTIDDDNAADN